MAIIKKRHLITSLFLTMTALTQIAKSLIINFDLYDSIFHS